MTLLSAEARALFDAARSGHEPNDADRARVKAAMLLRIATLAAATGTTQASAGATLAGGLAGSAASPALLAVKVALGAALLGLAGVASYELVSTRPSVPAQRVNTPAGASASARPRGAGTNFERAPIPRALAEASSVSTPPSSGLSAAPTSLVGSAPVAQPSSGGGARGEPLSGHERGGLAAHAASHSAGTSEEAWRRPQPAISAPQLRPFPRNPSRKQRNPRAQTTRAFGAQRAKVRRSRS